MRLVSWRDWLGRSRISYRGGSGGWCHAASAHIRKHQRLELGYGVSPVPAVDDGILEPTRELAAPARRSAQQLDPGRHGSAGPSGGGLPLLERCRILVLHLLVTDAFLRVQAPTQKEHEVVRQHEELVLDLCRYGAGSPGAFLGQKVLAAVKEFLDVPAQPIQLGNDSRRQVEFRRQKIVDFPALRVL